MNMPVHMLDKPGTDRKTPSAYETMHRLLHELLPHMKGMWVDGEPLAVTPVAEATNAN
jgi:hypothetical protein